MGQSLISLALLVVLVFLRVSDCVRFMGCYKEISSQARLLSGDKKDFIGTLTPEICIQHCKSKGFSYAGTQYGIECYCASERPSFKQISDPAYCNSKCEGNETKTCGGGFRLSVYDLEDSPVNFVQINYVGCYSDDGEARRALRDKGSPESFDMTPELCTGYCYSYGYRFAGLQARKQCFCGDLIKGERANEGDCNQECTGNSRFICGGSWRNSIYHTSISDESEEGRYLGCYKDSVDRLLTGYNIDLIETNSPRRCLNICLQLGFKYAGVEYRTECYCGDKKPDLNRIAPENDCQSPCPKTELRQCGGIWRINVYSTASPAPIQTPIVIVPGDQGTSIIKIPPSSYIQPTSSTNFSSTTESSSSDGNKEICTKSKTEQRGRFPCVGEELFHENFDSWNPQIWKHEIFMPAEPDYEFVVFDEKKENIFLSDGNLNIKPTIFSDEFVRKGRLRLEKCTGQKFTEECEREGRTFALLPPVRSARITTKDSFSFKYGKVVVQAKFPSGDWLVPEIWLEPKERVYGPSYLSGRIRIAQTYGNKELRHQGRVLGSKNLESRIYIGMGNKIRGRHLARLSRGDKGWHEDYHNFTLIWTPDSISFKVDNEAEEYLVPENSGDLSTLLGFNLTTADTLHQGSSIAPFDQEFYISLGLSVGGMREFPDKCITGQDHIKPWNNFAVKGLVDFWNDREYWYPTWNNNNILFKIEDVAVYAL